jgi:hypothetical protein
MSVQCRHIGTLSGFRNRQGEVRTDWDVPCKGSPAGEPAREQPSSIWHVSCSARRELRKSAEQDWDDLDYSLKKEAPK